MESYKQLQEQIKSLQSKAEEVRRSELSRTISDIRAKMEELGISVDDLQRAQGKQKSGRKVSAPVAPKYQDPASGKTWSGRGKEPKWLAGRSKGDFLIR
ncbi:MAG: histone family protein [Herminiimonas sp.]|nr:histone family protein [Herminiimonas sp.]MDB5852541.1 histone family protein [Herminiimonas sp.]